MTIAIPVAASAVTTMKEEVCMVNLALVFLWRGVWLYEVELQAQVRLAETEECDLEGRSDGPDE